METLAWETLKQDILNTFRPADYHRRARDELASCVQRGAVTVYIDCMKQSARKVHGIMDNEMLDRFVRGLQP